MDEFKKQKLIETVVKKYSLRLLLLFGSRVSKKIHAESDFDIAYLNEKNLGLIEEARLITELAPLLGSDNIDLLNLKKASPLVLFAVFNNCQVIYEENPLIFANLRAYSFKNYVETKLLYEQKFTRLKNQVL